MKEVGIFEERKIEKLSTTLSSHCHKKCPHLFYSLNFQKKTLKDSDLSLQIQDQASEKRMSL
jgi:hypothetical protein